jgi:c-di-GMP-binding flagellar brake protein YcgR
MQREEIFMSLLDVSMLKEGDTVNFINTNRTLFLGIVKKEYKGCLAIVIDINQDNYRNIKEKDEIEFIVAFKDEAIRCGTVVIASSCTHTNQLLLLMAPRIITTIERRQFKRLQTLIDIDYCFLPEGRSYDKLTRIESLWFKKMKRSFTVDISAGGICLITYEKDIQEKQALISMNIKDQDIVALCDVIRIEKAIDSKNQKTALKYIDMERNHIQLIDSYVLERIKSEA